MAAPKISAENIRAFARRDFTAVANLKREHWAARYRLHGAPATLAIARALFAHAQQSVIGYPTAAQRTQDLRDHLELKQKLDRIADVLRTLR